jgi:hypothetical protein
LKRADSAGSISKLEVLRKANAWLTGDIEDSSGITRDSADTESLIVDLIPFALSANTIDGVESSNAAALSIWEDLIHSASNDAESSLISISWGASAGLGLGIISGVSRAWAADSFNTIEVFSTIAGFGNSVVNFAGLTSNSADSKSSIEIGSIGAFLASTANKVESFLTDTLLVNEKHIRSTRAGGNWKRSSGNWSSGSRDTVSVVKNVSLDTFTWFGCWAVNSIRLTISTDSIDVKEASLTDALKGVEIKNFVGSAFRSADGELRIIVVRGSAICASSFNEVESIDTNTVLSYQSFIEATSRNFRGWGWGRWNVTHHTASLDQDVSRNTLAWQSG